MRMGKFPFTGYFILEKAVAVTRTLREMLSPLNFRLGVNEKRKVFMRVDERLFYIF